MIEFGRSIDFRVTCISRYHRPVMKVSKYSSITHLHRILEHPVVTSYDVHKLHESGGVVLGYDALECPCTLPISLQTSSILVKDKPQQGMTQIPHQQVVT